MTGVLSKKELEQKLVESERLLSETKKELTEERKQRKQLTLERDGLFSLIDDLPAYVCLLGNDYSIVLVNRYCREIFGNPEGKKCFEYFTDKSHTCPDCTTFKPGGLCNPGIIENVSPDGNTHYLVTNIILTDPTGLKQVLRFGIDIGEQKRTEENLLRVKEELELRVEERTNELQRKNIALTEVLSQLEVEKKNMANKINVNVQKLLLPVIDKLIEKSSSLDSRYLMMIKQNLERLTSSIGIKLSSIEYNLTPKEIELCALIKGGFSIKEIAAMQNLSERTVETHRLNIRKKLGLTSSKVNLSSYLMQL